MQILWIILQSGKSRNPVNAITWKETKKLTFSLSVLLFTQLLNTDLEFSPPQLQRVFFREECEGRSLDLTCNRDQSSRKGRVFYRQ